MTALQKTEQRRTAQARTKQVKAVGSFVIFAAVAYMTVLSLNVWLTVF